jgi:hypothetical protein
MPAKRFIVYCPTDKGDQIGEFFGSNRLFDVALHDYSGDAYQADTEAEYQFSGRLHKWAAIARNLPHLSEYAYYAFFDNDIRVSTEQLNRLFLIGEKHDLLLYQPSLAWNSFCTHQFLYFRPYLFKYVRPVPLVEVMCPFFSREALEKCADSFVESESGWGLDYVWKKLISPASPSIIDCVRVDHAKPMESESWILSNGMTPREEMISILERHGIDYFRRGPEGMLEKFYFSVQKRLKKRRRRSLKH